MRKVKPKVGDVVQWVSWKTQEQFEGTVIDLIDEAFATTFIAKKSDGTILKDFTFNILPK